MSKIKLYPCFEHWKNYNNIWLYSDPHFNDDEMKYLRKNYIGDDEQVKRINSKVGKNDMIIFLGDIGDVSFIKKIKGYKVLVKGNHDRGNSVYQRIKNVVDIDCNDYFEMSLNELSSEAYRLFPEDGWAQRDWVTKKENEYRLKAVKELKNNPDFVCIRDGRSYNIHAPFMTWSAYYDNKLFDEVYDGFIVINNRVVLSHEPVNIPCTYNIHGHTHNEWQWFYKDHCSLCAEHIDYTPINLCHLLGDGTLSNITNIHRLTIDNAVSRKQSKERIKKVLELRDEAHDKFYKEFREKYKDE